MGDTKDGEGAAFAATQLGIGDDGRGPAAARAPAGTPAPSPAPSDTDPQTAAPDEDDEGPDPFLGRVLGGLYKIENRIGEGGMGAVYAAQHVHLGKQFAVKVLSRRIASNKQAVERLRQEAVAASSIDHDNIIDVVSFDSTPDGDVFIVMELLRGMPLSDVVEKGPIPLPKALFIAHQMAEALHAAHERGIVHRDLKPENVFIVRKGESDFVKVLDFGISKIKSADTEAVRMTKTGQLVGTPLYMSPEQARGEMDVDRRADVYALGVILYEMIAGLPPFEGSNYFQLLWKHANEEAIAPSKKTPSLQVPAAVEAVVLRALAKRPEDRFQTMAELDVALSEAAPGVARPSHLISHNPTQTDAAIPAHPTKKNGPILVAGIVGVALLVGILAVVASKALNPPERTLASDIAPPAGGAGTTMAPDPPPTVDDPPQQPSMVEPPPGVDPPPVAQVSVRFESRPPGAEVRIGDRVLGTTPLVAPVDATGSAVSVRFHLAGFVDDVVSVVPADGARIEGRPRRRGGSGEGGSEGSPIPVKGVF